MSVPRFRFALPLAARSSTVAAIRYWSPSLWRATMAPASSPRRFRNRHADGPADYLEDGVIVIYRPHEDCRFYTTTAAGPARSWSPVVPGFASGTDARSASTRF